MESSREWYRDEFLISTSNRLLQPSAINAAFASDLLYWTKGMSEEGMKKMLSKSLCFGVYALPKSSSELAGMSPYSSFLRPLWTNMLEGRKDPAQIGLARLITDEVTFAYMTDVYILPEYQGKGLGTWLLECVNETIDSWPEFRRALLMTGNETGKILYKKKLGMEPFPQGKNGLEVLSKTGKGSVLPN
jgi:ribosomal protein S18 acetylase RimI-like enzyme